MGQSCRVLKSGRCDITQGSKTGHVACDLVKEGRQLDYIVAHTAGEVVAVVKNCNENTSGQAKYGSKRVAKIYGNYVKIKHSNGMYTLYAHMKYGSVTVNVGDKVSKGQVLGYMGNTGYSFGAHVHFEIRNSKNVCINPTKYLNADFVVATNTAASTAAFKTGNYKTLYNMKVRSGVWGSVKKVKNLTADGRRNATSKNLNADAVYKKGTIFTARKIINHTDGSVWAQSPSGYICIKEKTQTYCQKV